MGNSSGSIQEINNNQGGEGVRGEGVIRNDGDINNHIVNLITEDNHEDSSNSKISSIASNIKKLKNYIIDLNSESPAYKVNKLLYLQSKIKEISNLMIVIEKNELTFKQEVIKSFDSLIFCLLTNKIDDYDSKLLLLNSEIDRYILSK